MVEKTSKIIISPNYCKIYKDLIERKFPEKLAELSYMLIKENLNSYEVIKLNEVLFGKKSKKQQHQEQRYRAYDKQTILRILRYQQQKKLNNKELALHFKLSTNTIAKWKSIFGVYIKVSEL